MGRHLRRWPLRAAVLLITLLGLSVPGTYAADGAAGEETAAARRELERTAVHALAAGGDASAPLRALRALGPAAGRTPLPLSQSGDAALLVDALEDLASRSVARSAAAEDGFLADAIWRRFLAADLLVRDGFTETRRRLTEAGAGAEMMQRLDDAEARYAATVGALRGAGPEGAGPPAAALLAPPSPHVLGVGDLPFRRPELAPRPPRAEPILTPVYLDPSDPAPTAADRAGSAAAPLTGDVVARAEALGYDAVRVYEFVRNEVTTEHYAGALQGAPGTLQRRAGNDVDQAALLVALLRASSVPSRFVHGVVERSVEGLAAELGVPVAAVPSALARAGVAHRPVIRGGRVAAVEVEHTWVAARVPYGNYRGTLVDPSAPAWVPLAPALKSYAVTPPTGVLGEAGLTSGAALDHFLAAPRLESPLDWVRRRVEEWLTAEAPGESYDDQLGARSIEPLRLGLLPSTLPVPVVMVTGEAPVLAPEHLPTLRMLVRDGDGRPLLDHTAELHRIGGRRLTLSSTPATVDDDRVVNLYGGLDSVPAYLVRLRPRLRLDGRLLAVGEGDGAMGAEQSVELTLAGPWGSERLVRRRTAGAYHALAVGSWRAPSATTAGEPPSAAPDPADGEALAADLLAAVGGRFCDLWGAAEDELAALAGVSLVRPWPSIAVVTDEVAVTRAGDLPLELDWRGVSVDALLRAAEPLARAEPPPGAPDPERQWMRLAALHGSALEHRVFEEEFLVEAVSADKGLALARQAGVEVLTVDAGNLDAVLAGLGAHPQVVRDDVARRVGLGFVVTIPRRPVSLAAWTGSVWRAEDPETGSAGYLIAGAVAGSALNGGATAEPSGSWVLEFLAQALAAPYSATPNTDPMAGFRIAKVVSTDRQRDTAGQRLRQDLTVRVTDALGRPVQGAPVAFQAWSGGGSLLDADGVKTVRREVRTDRLGLASAPFVLGTDTGRDPVFVQGPEDPFHPTRVGANLVEAVAASAAGDLVLDGPFVALAEPGEPRTLRRTDDTRTHLDSTRAGLWVDTVRVAAEDRYGNPVSNLEVAFRAGEPVHHDGCSNDLLEPLNAVVFAPEACPVEAPVLGECGAPELVRFTSPSGAAAGVILGDSVVSQYRVGVESPGLDPLQLTYGMQFSQNSQSGACSALSSITAVTRNEVNTRGEVINATRVGSVLGWPLELTLFYWEPYASIVPGPDGGSRLELSPQGRWVPTVAGTVGFEVGGDGNADPAELTLDGTYRTTVTTGFAPGRYEVALRAEDVEVVSAVQSGGEVERRTERRDFSDLLTAVWGLRPRVVDASPAPIPLTDDGVAAQEVTVTYAIEPSTYRAAAADVLFYADGRFAAASAAGSLSGAGSVTVQRGFPFETGRRYTAQLVVNPGRRSEVRSGAFELPLTQRLFRDVEPSVMITQEVDLVNRRTCALPDLFTFGLNQDARVTLTLVGGQRTPGGGFEPDGLELTLLDDEPLARGDHSEPVSPGEVPPGEYRFLLTGVTADGASETHTGYVRSLYRERDQLPVGHVLVDGVDLFDGHLTLARTDFELAGRGLPLSLRRTWSSAAAGEPGGLGIGWTHNWDSQIVVTGCGEVIVLGGDGSGARFVDDGRGGLRPLRGHHGTLRADPDILSFDYYARSGLRYHYRQGGGERWVLDFVEDPSGNRTRLTYEESAVDPAGERLAVVTDAAGRRLRLRYEVMNTVRGPAELIAAAEGPGGLAMTFAYDEWGHQVRAAREPHGDGGPSRVESYTYELQPDGLANHSAFDDRHVLVQVADEVGGGATRYDWRHGAVGVQGNVVVPRSFVERVTRPEGGEVSFTYQPEALSSREPERIEVAVTDPRGEITVYTLNQYGAAVAIEGPEGGTTALEWAPADALLTARTDPNGTRTTYTYDTHGNLLTESIDVANPDGTVHTLVATNTYHPPGDFDPPYVKDRLASRTDRTGATTTFIYDTAGRLLREEIQVSQIDGGAPQTVVSSRTWLTNGDLASETDPRGHTTTYGYDAYGHPITVTDPLGGITRSTWDARGRLLTRTDPLGRTTRYRYDTLDRRVASELPPVDGESGAPVEEVRYDDAARIRTTVDALGRTAVDRFDREGRLVERRNPAGGIKLFAHDAAGNKTLETTWHDATTPRHDVTFTYAAAGRLIRRSEPLGRTTEYGYDAAGNLVRETLLDTDDPGFSPRVTEHAYDALNRRVETRRLLAGTAAVTRTRRDGEGRPVETTDPLGRSTFVRYDELGRQIERSEPPWTPGERTITRFVYDAAGNLVEERLLNQPVPRVRTSDYDALNRRVRATDGTGGTTHFEYDAVGNLIRRVDPRLDVVSHTYDARDRRTGETVHLTRVTEPPRRVTTAYEYDAVGNRTAELLPNGNRIEHTYDVLDRRTASRDDLGSLSAAAYDARGNRTSATDAEGHRTATTYDALDRPVEETAPLDRTTRWSWDVAGNRLSETTPRGHTTAFTYDTLDRRTAETDPLGESVTFTYDLAGNLLTRTDKRGHTTTHEYDALDRRVRTVDPAPLATETRTAYDAAGRPVRATDRRGVVTETTYDAEGRSTEVRRDGVLLERRSYDPAGNLRFLTDANGHTTGYEYDERGLRLAENRPLAAVTRWTFDDMGDEVATRDPEGRVTTRTYDLRRRPLTETDPAGAITTWTYDLDGNRLTEIRPEGNTWRYGHDAAHRLTAVTDPLGAATTYTYDADDHRLTHTDANGHTTTFTYDPLGRRTSRTTPDGAVEEMSYDPAGHLARHTDPAGQQTTYSYDPLGRETLRSYGPPATPTGDDLTSIATSRDGNGNPTRVTETYSGATGTRTTTRTYDPFDRLESETDPEGNRLAYTYDANGNRLTLTGPGGSGTDTVTRYAYDALNRPTAVTTDSGITEYAWLRDGRLSEVLYPSGTRSVSTYDTAGRSETIISTQGATPVSTFGYTYDANGNRLTQTETRGTGSAETTTYTYDAADRLFQASYPETTVTYSYDAVGNRLTELEEATDGSVTRDRLYTYDQRHRLLSLTDRLAPDGAGTTTFTYDPAGNRRSKTTPAGDITTYLYGPRNRLTEVHEKDLLLETYRYDHRGLRIRRAGPEGVVHAVYDDTSLLLETDPAGNPLRRYHYGPDRLLSLTESTGERRYYLFDALGSVTDLVSPTGAVEARYVYDAWGNLRRELGASENPFAFTGHQLDRPTGLYYAKARYYDPQLGLFLTEDPFQGEIQNPPSLHRYLYAYQNPLVYVDPDGRQAAFTPGELTWDALELEQLTAELVEARAAAETLLDRAGELSDEELQWIALRPIRLQSRIDTLRERIHKAEQFFGEVYVLLEGAESVQVQRQRLQRFLDEDKRLSQRESVRLTTAILGPNGCDSRCQRLPSLTDAQMRALVLVESAVGNIALGGLFELGILALVDDALRATVLLDDGVRVADRAVEMGDDLVRIGSRRGFAREASPGKTGGQLFDELPESGRAADDIGNKLRDDGSVPRATGLTDDVLKLPVSESWGNPRTLARHFRDHGADFGAASADDYARQASTFLQRAQRQGLPTKIDADGVIRVYDPATNTFGAYNPSGTTRTFFKPTSPTYFERQPGVPPWQP